MMTRYYRSPIDHFEPESSLDAASARRLKGVLEKIDYTAFASNKAVLGAALETIDEGRFQKLAFAAAQARARWVASAVKAADHAHAMTPAEVAELAGLRAAFDEFAAAYEALRRMVERGYVKLAPPQTIATAQASVEIAKAMKDDKAV